MEKNGTVKMRGGRFSYSEDKTFTAHIDMKTKQFSIVPEFAPNGALALTYSVKNDHQSPTGVPCFY